jgi:hypothetical protein
VEAVEAVEAVEEEAVRGMAAAAELVLAGFNDLATLYPSVAKEAYGWDPSEVISGSAKKLPWLCEAGHLWESVVRKRLPPQMSGCPTCANYGFKPSKAAWFYLLQRPGEQQIGITNEPEIRLPKHIRNGWFEVEISGPHPGKIVQAIEVKLKQWLRKEVGLVPGTHENWFTASLEVRSLAELKTRSGVETDLF